MSRKMMCVKFAVSVNSSVFRLCIFERSQNGLQY